MKPGTIIRLPDGREATVVFHGLIGYGIQWGRIKIDEDEIRSGDGNTFQAGMPDGWQWEPEAMLREPSVERLLHYPCVGEVYEIVSSGKDGAR